jgi:hypothetical protein
VTRFFLLQGGIGFWASGKGAGQLDVANRIGRFKCSQLDLALFDGLVWMYIKNSSEHPHKC